jgi:hypothetical protein
VYLERHVVDAFAPLLQIRLDRGAVFQRFKEFHLADGGVEKVGTDVLEGDVFGLIGTDAEEVVEAIDDGIHVVGGNADVVESNHIQEKSEMYRKNKALRELRTGQCPENFWG